MSPFLFNSFKSLDNLNVQSFYFSALKRCYLNMLMGVKQFFWKVIKVAIHSKIVRAHNDLHNFLIAIFNPWNNFCVLPTHRFGLSFVASVVLVLE